MRWLFDRKTPRNVAKLANIALRQATPPFYATYRFGALTPQGGVIQGTLHESFVGENGTLAVCRRFRSDDGDLEETSTIRFSPQWRPLAFDSAMSIERGKRKPRLHAAYGKRAVDIDYRENAEERRTLSLPVEPGNYDEYQIDQLLRHVDWSKVEAARFCGFNSLYGYNLRYLLRRAGEESAQTPAGVVPCVKVTLESSNEEFDMRFRQTALYMRDAPFCLLSKRGGRVSLTLDRFSTTPD